MSVLYLFLAAVMFSSCALMFTFLFQELLISSRIEIYRVFMFIFAVSVLYLFLATVMFSSGALMFTFLFQKLLIIFRLELSRVCMLSFLESLPVALSCVS